MNRVPHIQVPPSELYWAVIDDAPAASQESLRYAFEEQLPVAVEEVHAVFRPLGGGRVLACGAPAGRVRDAVRSGAVSMIPEAIPAWIEGRPDAASVQLLCGEFAPAGVRRRRRWAAAVAVAGILVCAGLMVTGFERRRFAAIQDAVAAQTALESVADGLGLVQSASNPQTATLRLAAAVRSMRSAAESASQSGGVTDATTGLEALLRSWPRDLKCRADQVAVVAASATVSVQVRDQRDAQALAEALGGSSEWEPQEPRVTASREGAVVRLQLKRKGSPG